MQSFKLESEKISILTFLSLWPCSETRLKVPFNIWCSTYISPCSLYFVLLSSWIIIVSVIIFQTCIKRMRLDMPIFNDDFTSTKDDDDDDIPTSTNDHNRVGRHAHGQKLFYWCVNVVWPTVLLLLLRPLSHLALPRFPPVLQPSWCAYTMPYDQSCLRMWFMWDSSTVVGFI